MNEQNPYIICSNRGEKIPPFILAAEKHVLGRDASVADFVVPAEWNVYSRIQATFKLIDNHYHIFDGDGIKPSSNRLYVNNCLITPHEGYVLKHGDVIKIGGGLQSIATIEYYEPASVKTAGATVLLETPPPSSQTILLGEDINLPVLPQQEEKLPHVINLRERKSLTIGRASDCDLVLSAPTVSRKHAVIEYVSEGNCILTNYSPNGVFVNGIPIKGRIALTSGVVIRIVPYTFVFEKDRLLTADTGETIRLDAKNITLVVKGKKGEDITLLNHICLPIEPGQLVALVGGSGAGKSTLLRTLLGIQAATSGVVYLNGEDLTTNFNLYRHQIGYVPQTDIVHRDLRVEEVLRYAVKLRLPPDADVDAIIEKTLADIEMLERRDVLVKNLSGGQLKRVSIGVELLVNPKLFFLDEPTSGLDPGLDKKMMLLLRKLADQGRTIILVTHATTNIKLCDRIVFLGRGGNLCFYGSYEEAREFFGLEDNKDFADVYLELDSLEAVKQTAERYQQSPYYTKNITQKLAALPETRCQKPKPKAAKAGFWRQLVHLCNRYLQLVLRDRSNLIISLLTAPIGILLIRLAARDRQPFIPGEEGDATMATFAQTVIFVFTCAAIWVGLASSLQEIVKENDIYGRERLVNLNLLSYLGSKITILSLLAGLQTFLMVLVTLLAFSPPKPEMISWWLGLTITTFLSIAASVCLGLMVSALVKNTTQANSALPLLLLPQIIFSGVLFEAKGVVEYVSWLMASRWSVGAYGSLVNINSLIPPPVRLPGGEEVAQPFTEKYMYEPSWDNLTANWEMLLVHCGIYLVITYLAQRKKDII